MLVADGLCSRQQVEDAVQNQVILGGRIGTNLVELGVIDEETLARYLSRLHELPALSGEQIHPDPEVLALMPREAVDRLDIIPFIREAKRIQVLCVDPRDVKALDEVAFITGLTPDPIVVPEVRFWQLLRACYGIERQLRYVALDTHDFISGSFVEEPPLRSGMSQPGEDLISEESFDKLYQRRDGFPQVTSTDPPALPSASMPLLSAADLEAIEEETSPGPPGHIERRVWQAPLVEDGRRRDDRREEEPAPPEAPQTPLTFAEATRALSEVSDRQAIARCVLRYAASVFRRAMLFTVHRGVALGWNAVGEGLDRRAIRKLVIPLDSPSIFKLVVDSRAHYLGGLRKTPVNIQFLRGTGRQIPLSALMLPILVRGRVVNVLYGDNGHNRHCPSDVGDLLILAQRIAQSYEVLFEQKRAAYRARQPDGETPPGE